MTARASRPAALTVALPDLPSVPEPFRGRPFTLSRGLLAPGDTNPKLRKSQKADPRYRAWGLSLAPAGQSGYPLCASASPGCRAACLYRQGRGRLFPAVAAARVARAVAFAEHRDWFEATLRWELGRIAGRAGAEGFTPAVRLNVLSDVPWERVLPRLFEGHPGVRFYDYTKHVRRMLRRCHGLLPPNYHLTFSRSETNHADALAVLAGGGNVAVVFRDKPFPALWDGHPVVDGDRTDLRFLDPANVVVGLRARGTARHDRSGFVVDVASRRPLPLLDRREPRLDPRLHPL